MANNANNMQILVDCFDDIPSIMTKINASLNDSPTRFKATGRNTSFSADGVMRAHQKVDISKKENSHRVERMATQAMRVLDQLSKIPGQHKKPKRTVQETSSIAQAKLKSLSESGIDLQRFYNQYDVSRTGKVSYKDFCDTLLAVSSGIGREEAHELAAKLDTRRVGSIDYTHILDSLKDIQRSSTANATRRTEERRDVQQHYVQRETAPLPMEAPPAEPIEASAPPPNYEYSGYNSEFLPPPPPLPVLDTSSKVVPRTSFAYIDRESPSLLPERSDSPGAHDIPPPPPRPPRVMKSRLSERSIVQMDAPPAGVASKDMATVLSTREHTPAPLTPSDAESAHSIIARRFFHNPTVNTVVYGQRGRVAAYDFDPQREGYMKYPKKGRSASAPAGRRSHLRDSGCNLDPPPPPVPEFGPTFASSLRNSPTSTTDMTAEEAFVSSKLESNPFYKAHEKAEEARRSIVNQERKTLENSIVDQIGGGVTRLRYMLKQFDASQSGTLNYEEFQNALKKSGVQLSKDQYKDLYQQTAREVTTAVAHGYSRGKAVDIDAFANKLQAQTTSKEFVPPPPGTFFEQRFGNTKSFGEDAKHHETVRVMKKVLHSQSKLTNPYAVYKYIEPQHNGYLSEPQLKDALGHMGANLTSNEMNVLMNNIPRDGDGKIEIARFENVLKHEVGAYDKADSKSADRQHRQFSHYNRSFRNSRDFSLAHEYQEFEPLCHTKGHAVPAETSKRWNQLKDVFQAHPEVVRGAFSVPKPTTPDRKSFKSHSGGVEVDRDYTRSLSVTQLKENLAKSGLPLSADDVLKIESTLKRQAPGKEISLEKFCEVVGLEVHNKDKNKIELSNVHEHNEDGGVFAPSVKTQNANPTIATTFYIGSSDNSDKTACTGSRRRRGPSALTTSDPSKFWEMDNAPANRDNGLSALFPSPMPTFRSPNIYDTARGALVADATAATRGQGRLHPNEALHHHLNSVAELAADEVHRGRTHLHPTEHVPPRRSASAPPRTLLGRVSGMVNNRSQNMFSLLHQQPPDNASTSSISSATHTATSGMTSNDASYLNKVQTAAKIARWAPGSLANYYQNREGIVLGAVPSTVENVESAPKRVRPTRRQFAHTPFEETNPVGIPPPRSISRSSHSVSSGAPFATGDTYA